MKRIQGRVTTQTIFPWVVVVPANDGSSDDQIYVPECAPRECAFAELLLSFDRESKGEGELFVDIDSFVHVLYYDQMQFVSLDQWSVIRQQWLPFGGLIADPVGCKAELKLRVKATNAVVCSFSKTASVLECAMLAADQQAPLPQQVHFFADYNWDTTPFHPDFKVVPHALGDLEPKVLIKEEKNGWVTIAIQEQDLLAVNCKMSFPWFGSKASIPVGENVDVVVWSAHSSKSVTSSLNAIQRRGNLHLPSPVSCALFSVRSSCLDEFLLKVNRASPSASVRKAIHDMSVDGNRVISLSSKFALAWEIPSAPLRPVRVCVVAPMHPQVIGFDRLDIYLETEHQAVGGGSGVLIRVDAKQPLQPILESISGRIAETVKVVCVGSRDQWTPSNLVKSLSGSVVVSSDCEFLGPVLKFREWVASIPKSTVVGKLFSGVAEVALLKK